MQEARSIRISAAPAQEPKSTTLLDVRGITVRFGGIVALDGVSFDVEAGDICGLIGPNGAGKSTLFNCLSRLYKYSSGSITFEGIPLEGMARHRMAAIGIGRTFQNLALFGSMSVMDNVKLGSHATLHAGFLRSALRTPGTRRMEADVEAQAQAMIETLSLQAVAQRIVSDLPFAIQKRVEFARALAGKPKLLLLDEPACGLNHEELDELGETIRSVRDRMGIAILLVEHHMGLVMGLSDKVVALNFGRKIAEGTPAAVRSHPAVIEAYLGSAES